MPGADIERVLEVLPHRYPFLMIDRVLEASPDGVRAVKNVSVNEPQFTGHFPGLPIMPGVLIVEAMAQASAFLLGERLTPGQIVLLTGVEKARFRRKVVPGDQLVIEAKLVYFRSGMGRTAATGTVDGQLAAEAEILFAVAPVS